MRITEEQVSKLGFTLGPFLRVELIFYHGQSIFDLIQMGSGLGR